MKDIFPNCGKMKMKPFKSSEIYLGEGEELI